MELNKSIKQATKWSAITEIAVKLITPITNAILARTLAPEAFGVVATLTMVVSFAEIFTDAGFQKFLVQHQFETEDELNKSTNVAFWTNLMLALVIWAGIACFVTPLANLVGSPGCELAIIVISAQIPLMSLSSVQLARYRRDLDFKSIFSVQLSIALVPVVVTVPLALAFKSYWALVAGTLARDVLRVFLLAIKSKQKIAFYYSFDRLKEMLSFSLWTVIERIANWMTNYADTFIVGSVLNAYFLGLYKTTISTTNAYMGIVSAIVTPVLFSALSRCQDDDHTFRNVFFSFQRMTALFVFPIGCGAFVYRELVTLILLGDQWADTADFVGLWSLISCIAIIFSQLNSELYRSKGRPRLAVLQQVLQLVALIPALLWSVTVDYEMLTVVRSLVRVEAILVSAIITRLFIGIRFWEVIRNVWPSLVASVVMAFVGVGLRCVFDNVVWELTTIVVCVFVYTGIMLVLPEGRTQIAQVPFLRKILRLENESEC